MLQEKVESDFQQRVALALVELLPRMVVDGGGARIVGAEGKTVRVELVGSCVVCPSKRRSAQALRQGLMAHLPEIQDVEVVVASVGSTYSVLAALPIIN